MKKLTCIAALCAALAGCATSAHTVSTDAEPLNYVSAIKLSLQRSLKDPSSVRDARISTPFQVSQVFDGVSPFPHSGWAVCLEANAKNSYGGYTGVKPMIFVFDGNQIGAMIGGNYRNEAQAEYHCRTANYRSINL